MGPYADTLFLNGTVLTVDPGNRVVEAVAVRDGRIIATGDAGDIRDLAGPDTRTVDLAGRVMIPGIIDSHGHFPGWGEQKLFRANLNGPPMGEITSIANMVAVLQRHAARTENDDWILGAGYELDLLQENRHPTRSDLDLVSSDRPVVVHHVSHHICVANSFALALAGITSDTPQPSGGLVQKNPDSGEPTGVLEEFSAMALVTRHIPPLSRAKKLQALEQTVADYLEVGVTTTQNGMAGFNDLDILEAGLAANTLKCRVVIWLGWQDHLRALNGEREVNPMASDLIIPGAAKIFADGSIPGYTGYLTAPYHTPHNGDDQYCGYPLYPPEELAKIVADLHARKQQIAIHGNGDAAIDDILAAFEAAHRANPRSDTRHIIVHAQTARADQLDRMAKLGVIPTFYIMHAYYWGNRHRDIYLGEERAMNISPAGGARERGMRYTIHCDTPVVPMNPALMMWSAVNRITLDGTVIGPHQRVSAQDALRATTIDAAYQGFFEQELGSIELGKRADFAIVDNNPLAGGDDLKNLKVSQTVLGGEIVYET